jgi:hypothetical protein
MVGRRRESSEQWSKRKFRDFKANSNRIKTLSVADMKNCQFVKH